MQTDCGRLTSFTKAQYFEDENQFGMQPNMTKVTQPTLAGPDLRRNGTYWF